MNVVYQSDTGRAVSFGSVVASPLPEGMSSMPLTAVDAELLRRGGGRWDATSLRIVPNSGWLVVDGVIVPPPAPEVDPDAPVIDEGVL